MGKWEGNLVGRCPLPEFNEFAEEDIFEESNKKQWKNEEINIQNDNIHR